MMAIRNSHSTPRSAFSILLQCSDSLVAGVVTFCSTVWLKVMLKLNGCRYGSRLRADGRVIVRLRCKGALLLGDNVTLRSRFMSNLVGMTNPTVFHCIGDGRICIGDNSGCSSTVFSSRTKIEVGRNVNIGGNVRVYDHDYHAIDYLARRDAVVDGASCATAAVVIGDDVFIGTNAIILKGVTIGARSVIGAGAVVSLKNIPPDSVVAGNPARVLKSLSSGNRASG
jgi:acetyltransferase-like isoleucine patch superfamily enzyme